MKPKALVWFTGVISQYNVNENYNISKIKLNLNLLNKLDSVYDISFLVYCRDNSEVIAYKELLKENNLSKIPVYFASYDISFKEVLFDCYERLGKFILIDYSKKRLAEASQLFQSNDMIHLSQLLD